MKNFIVNAYEKSLVVLAWIILIAGAIIGFYIGTPAFSYGNNFAIAGLFFGLIAGLLIDVIFLGYLFQISSIRKDIENIKLEITKITIHEEIKK